MSFAKYARGPFPTGGGNMLGMAGDPMIEI